MLGGPHQLASSRPRLPVREVLSIHIGQAGVQTGNACWELCVACFEGTRNSAQGCQPGAACRTASCFQSPSTRRRAICKHAWPSVLRRTSLTRARVVPHLAVSSHGTATLAPVLCAGSCSARATRVWSPAVRGRVCFVSLPPSLSDVARFDACCRVLALLQLLP